MIKRGAQEVVRGSSPKAWEVVRGSFRKSPTLPEAALMGSEGNKGKNVSVNLIHALDHAKNVGAKILGITGRDGGYTSKVANVCLIIPSLSQDTITPHAEAWQAVVWHMLVTEPRIKEFPNKWESLST